MKIHLLFKIQDGSTIKPIYPVGPTLEYYRYKVPNLNIRVI